MNYNDDSNMSLLSLLTNLNPYGDIDSKDYAPLNLECSLNICPYEHNASFQPQSILPKQSILQDFNSNTNLNQEINENENSHSNSSPMPTQCPCSIAFSDTSLVCIPNGVMHNVNEGTTKVLKPIHLNNSNLQNTDHIQKSRHAKKLNENHGLCVIC